ncbi:hypothetical protein N9891_01775 [bacterium]|nr:hypothetical protein [bacterium]
MNHCLPGTLVSSHDGDHVLIPIPGDDGIPTIQIISSECLDATGKRFWPPQAE